MSTATIWRTCPHCGADFGQPDDPGRKRRYCSDACKQAAYRARRRAERHGWQHDHAERERQEQARRARDREEQHRREQAREDAWRYQQRQHHDHPPPSADAGQPREPAQRARARRTIDALLRKAERTNFPHEAAACRAKAEELRRKHRL